MCLSAMRRLFFTLPMILVSVGADDPNKAKPKDTAPTLSKTNGFNNLDLKPKPLPPIPDDPPPHEGAMADFPEYVIEPPDLLLVEVLEALPGRPITGERLVRPDGTITLGFYGDVHV